MLMGIGNLTELTDVDSAGVNVAAAGLLPGAGHPQRADDAGDQLGPDQRARVRPGAAAGALRGPAPGAAQASGAAAGDACAVRGCTEFGDEELDRLAAQIKDHNFRLFAEHGRLHVVSAELHLQDADPFVLFEQLLAAAAAARRSLPRVLPGLRNGQGPDGADAGQGVPAGRGVGLGLPDAPRQSWHRQSRRQRRHDRGQDTAVNDFCPPWSTNCARRRIRRRCSCDSAGARTACSWTAPCGTRSGPVLVPHRRSVRVSGACQPTDRTAWPNWSGGWTGLVATAMPGLAAVSGRRGGAVQLRPEPQPGTDRRRRATTSSACPRWRSGLYDWVVAFDHVRQRAWLISQGLPEPEPARRRQRAAAAVGEPVCSWLEDARPRPTRP